MKLCYRTPYESPKVEDQSLEMEGTLLIISTGETFDGLNPYDDSDDWEWVI